MGVLRKFRVGALETSRRTGMALDEGNNVVVRLRSRGPERRPSGRPDQCLRHGAPAGSGVWFWAFEEVHMLELVFDPSGIDFDRPGKHNYDVAFHIDGERLAE